jgi:hypothetical protein
MENYIRALKAYDFSLAINPVNTFALFNKGNILSNLDRFQEAVDAYLAVSRPGTGQSRSLTHTSVSVMKSWEGSIWQGNTSRMQLRFLPICLMHGLASDL